MKLHQMSQIIPCSSVSRVILTSFIISSIACITEASYSNIDFRIRRGTFGYVQRDDSSILNLRPLPLFIRGGDSEEQAGLDCDDDEEKNDAVQNQSDDEIEQEEEGEDLIHIEKEEVVTNDHYSSEYESEYESGDETKSDESEEENEEQETIGVEVMIQEEAEQSSVTLSVSELTQRKEKALELRTKGKEYHDIGNFDLASITFRDAAIKLEEALEELQEHEGDNQDLLTQLTEERATCRLHEALCHLKNKKFAESVASCTAVLKDGVEVIEIISECEDDSDDSLAEDEDGVPTVETVVRVNAEDDEKLTSSSTLSPAVRARAYHRRAKARLALGDTPGALDDSRSAAFLGDRNAVALYGRLMRESSGTGSMSENMFDSSSAMNGLFGSSSSPFDSFMGSSPFSSDASASSGSTDLLSSLLGSGSPNSSDSSSLPFSPLSMLGGMNGAGSEGGMGSLAKSVLTSIAKKAEDEETQEQICSYLNALDASQIISLSSMAGMPLNQNTADRIVSFANGVTPRGINKSVKLTKKIIFVGNLMRKTFKVIGKYKHLIILACIIGWLKSAIQRPIVVKKVVQKTAETTASFLL
ncbi:hypothetical protein CTEN210_11172 [Chaetoceros tenuissimus]|uniref:Uncharacterized protein n=1 Tax=Chaetoceros tenuissimus TaxID=426638 RepID=A0AAD3D0U0_9STRA|nr:hypothetical protein CTEN210_11172 [Chaetoceros tenuissimus]